MTKTEPVVPEVGGDVPRCPVHGVMRYVFAMCQWVCKGYDGEGCPVIVTDEEMARSERVMKANGKARYRKGKANGGHSADDPAGV